MNDNSQNSNLGFLAVGGEMGELMRKKEWNKTVVGPPDGWTQSLRTTLSIILNSKFPMFLFWGPELICFYNDAYRPSLGKEGKHPHMLGERGKEHWEEIWHIIHPLIDQVLTTGEATWSEDQLLPIYRNGKMEDVYWTFSYSPVQDESGRPAGVFVTCTETTEKVHTIRDLKTSQYHFQTLVQQEITATAIFKGEDFVLEVANEAALSLWGKDHSVAGKPLVEFLPELEQQGFVSIIREVFTTGTAHREEEAEMYFNHQKTFVRFYIDFSCKALRNNNNEVTSVLATCIDVTEKVFNRNKLQESLDQLHFAIESAELGTWDINPIQNTFTANERLKEWFGYSPEDTIQLEEAINNAVVKEDRERVQEALAKAFDFSSGGNYDIEYSIINPVSKNEMVIRAKGKAQFNDDKLAYRFTGAMQDITDKHQAEKERQKLIGIIEASHEFIGLAGLDAAVQYLNPAALKMLGWEEIKGKSILDCIYPEDREFAKKALPELFEKGHFSHEMRFVNAQTDEPFWVQWNGVGIKDPQTEQIIALATVSPNITARKIADEKLQNALRKAEEEEGHFRNLIMQSPIPMTIIRGNDYTIEMANTAMLEKVWRKKRNDVIGKTLQEAFPESRDENYLAILNKVFKTGKSHSENEAETQVEGADGLRKFYLDYKCTPLFHADGTISRIIVTIIDVTKNVEARKRVEEFTHQLENQVENRTRLLKESNEKLEQSIHELEKTNAELQSFAYISSHDMQEPLRKIQTFASRIRDKESQNLSAKGKDYFQRMENSAHRMQTLIMDLLSYSRTTTNERVFEKTKLTKIVEEIKEDFKEALEEKGATMKVGTLCEVDIIVFQFRQLITNLVSNSIKFSKSQEPLQIIIKSKTIKGSSLNIEGLSKQKKYCHLTYNDNGIGFDPKHEDRVFLLFQRLHGKNEYQGTGIGLSIVKKIIENHSGVINAKSKAGEGVTFNIYLPV